MAASVGVLKNTILLGQVIPSTLTKAVKVQVPYFVYDDILGAYFKKTKDFVAEDSLKVCWSSYSDLHVECLSLNITYKMQITYLMIKN